MRNGNQIFTTNGTTKNFHCQHEFLGKKKKGGKKKNTLMIIHPKQVNTRFQLSTTR